jgi:hypothetical protein
MVKALAPPCEKWGANRSAINLREEFIIRVQRKKKKRCLSVNQEEKKGFSFLLEEVSGEVSDDISFFVF